MLSVSIKFDVSAKLIGLLILLSLRVLKIDSVSLTKPLFEVDGISKKN